MQSTSSFQSCPMCDGMRDMWLTKMGCVVGEAPSHREGKVARDLYRWGITQVDLE